MKFRILILSILIFLELGCATSTSKSDSLFIDKPIKGCVAVGLLTGSGFNIFPPVAKAIAKAMLEKGAEQFNANKVMISKQSGTFMVEMQATAYVCPGK